MAFSRTIQIRWSDIDANRHLRHSAYYDYGAALRIMFLAENGLTTNRMEELQIGPILFREEAIFKREIILEDVITVDVELSKATENFSRWSLRHNFVKADGTLAALVTIDAAWMDLVKRKLTVPDESIRHIFELTPKSSDFQLIISSKKTG